MSEGVVTQQEAQRLFEVCGFLLLQDLPPSTELSINASSQAYMINDQFQGIKLLPPGWHCVSWNIHSSEVDTDGKNVTQMAFGGQGVVKHVLLRWFEQGEVTVRTLDRSNEELVVPGTRRNSSRKCYRKLDSPGSHRTPTIVSRDLLKDLDAQLLPYPAKCHDMWTRATRNLSLQSGQLGRAVVAKVMSASTESGDSTMDTLTGGTSPPTGDNATETEEIRQRGNLGRSEQGKRIWGKSRSESGPQLEELSEDEDEGHDQKLNKRKREPDDASILSEQEDDGTLQFTEINLRRSWPANALGPEITKWSRDKSWLLSQTMERSYIGIPEVDRRGLSTHCAILCELELAFILFLQAGNACCLEQWKRIVTLFCCSSSYLGAGSEWQPHPSFDDAQEQGINGDAQAHSAFLQALIAQMALLDNEFWSNQTNPSDEKSLLTDLERLRANIGRSLSWRAATAGSHDLSQRATDAAVNDLIGAWRKFSHLTLAKFGWQLDRRLDEEVEVDQDLEAEQGDDAPVVVEM